MIPTVEPSKHRGSVTGVVQQMLGRRWVVFYPNKKVMALVFKVNIFVSLAVDDY